MSAIEYPDSNHFQFAASGGMSGEHFVGRAFNLAVGNLNKVMSYCLGYSTKLMAGLTQVISKSIAQKITTTKL
jgi:hypothetical protein